MKHDDMSIWKSVSVLILVLTLWLPSQAGTRIYQPLTSVLKQNPGMAVVEARVVRREFFQRDSSDNVVWEVENVKVHRWGKLQGSPGPELRFSAFRPAVTSSLKNRSPYSTGSSMEFSTQDGQVYLFLCLSPQYVVRVESPDKAEEILEVLGGRSGWFCDRP
jgi:hypothetical protein